MLNVRSIIQLKSSGNSNRKIAKNLSINRKTVDEYVSRFISTGLPYEELLIHSDSDLAQFAFELPPAIITDPRKKDFQKRLPLILEQLSKPRMTRMIIWEDYRREAPDGYSYSQFCDILGRHLSRRGAVLVHEHEPGKELYFDYAGDKLEYIDRETGELVKCPVFIAVLPYSGCIFADVYPSQKREQLLSGMSSMMTYFDGVTESVTSDNMAQYVTKTNKYEPVFEQLAQQWSLHYGTSLLATRVAKPRDKAAVESAVNVVYRRIYAILVKEPSYSLEELRMKFRVALEQLNSRPMQKHGRSRKEVFLSEEKPLLRPLPDQSFVQKFSTEAKVQYNYHITIGKERHSYSVPYQYIGKQVRVIYDTDHVEIYCGHTRIAMHNRNYRNNKYTTDKSHMPEAHQHVRGWNESYFLEKAAAIGPFTVQAIEKIISQQIIQQQTYNSCRGTLQLAQKYSPERLEAACKRALEGPKITWTILSDILKRNLDQVPTTDLFSHIPPHENLRGYNAYVN